MVLKEKAYVYFDPISGSGGMPVTVQGKAAIIYNEKTNKNDLFLLARNLLKCGCSIILVSQTELSLDLSELETYNCFITIKSIPFKLAKAYSKEGGIRAFFSCARTTKEANSDSELIDEKVFAPLLF